MSPKPLEILLVEDSIPDIILMKRMLSQVSIPQHLHIVYDGIEAINFLHQKGKYEDKPLPNLILLDLNLPRKNGKEVLKEIKEDNKLRPIPVIIITTSDSDQDILDCYQTYASSYLVKPANLREFDHCIKALEKYWFEFVRYPMNN